jgi:hypothetical protein
VYLLENQLARHTKPHTGFHLTKQTHTAHAIRSVKPTGKSRKSGKSLLDHFGLQKPRRPKRAQTKKRKGKKQTREKEHANKRTRKNQPELLSSSVVFFIFKMRS